MHSSEHYSVAKHHQHTTLHSQHLMQSNGKLKSTTLLLMLHRAKLPTMNFSYCCVGISCNSAVCLLFEDASK